MPYLVVSLHDVAEFGGFDTLPEGATIRVEGGQFVLVAAAVEDLVDARYSNSVNADLIDGGSSSTSNTDIFDGGASA